MIQLFSIAVSVESEDTSCAGAALAVQDSSKLEPGFLCQIVGLLASDETRDVGISLWRVLLFLVRNTLRLLTLWR